MELIILLAIGWGAYMWLTRDTSKPQPPNIEGHSNDRAQTSSPSTSTYQHHSHHRPKPKVDHTGKVTNEVTIKRAIERNQKVNFRYVDQNGEVTTRTVKPLRLERRHETQILCLVAHCDLRNAERSFVVWRMRHVKAV